MRLALSAAALLLAAAAAAQDRPNTSQPRDPQEAVRSRADGAAGGTGDPAARGDSVRGGMDMREKKPQGRVHDERSSDRKKGRGADGRARPQSQ